ncbi:MAG: glycosyltransferase family 2 protein [Actinomycetota bacterium]
MFSIIMATYNCGQKVESTLQSIFSQNRELFEIIIIDNASTDDTLDYIKKYENEVTLISEKDDGVYFAFNKGIDLAQGKYIYFIGAGDYLKPAILAEIKEFLPLETPSLVYGKCYFLKQKVFNGKEFDSKLFVRDNLCQQGIFYHREIFKLVGKFDLRYKILSDWLFNLKCFIHQGITKRYIDRVIADYEEGGLSAEISCDPVFLKEFPLFVRQQFGLYNYLICKAFLKNPYLFNYVYYKKYYLLLTYLASNNFLIGYFVSFAKPYIRGYRSLKKVTKNKN